jgi:hypothetical protein
VLLLTYWKSLRQVRNLLTIDDFFWAKHFERFKGDADVILANSRFTASVIARHLPTISLRTRVVYPGINIESYKPLPSQEKEVVYSQVIYLFKDKSLHY